MHKDSEHTDFVRQYLDQVTASVSPETASKVSEAFKKFEQDPLAATVAVADELRVRADELEAEGQSERLSGLDVFLSTPPNPSDLRRTMEEERRLDAILSGPLSSASIQQLTPGLACNFCGEVLSPELKAAIVPLILERPSRTTLACLECTEVAYQIPRREERLPALLRRRRARRLRQLRNRAAVVFVGLMLLYLFYN